MFKKLNSSSFLDFQYLTKRLLIKDCVGETKIAKQLNEKPPNGKVKTSQMPKWKIAKQRRETLLNGEMNVYCRFIFRNFEGVGHC